MNKLIFTLLSFILPFLYSFSANPQKKFFKETDWVFIPTGTYVSQENQKTYSIHAFYILKTEVTNLQYHEFLSDLKTQNRTEEYQKALPDTNAWNMKGVSMQPYVDYYFSHPAYHNYPVVNVSFEAAELFCKWLSEKLAVTFPDLHLNDVRIPTSGEWEYAASGGLQNVNYSWGTNYLRNAKGECMGNFCQVGDERITRNKEGFEIVENYGANMGVAGILSDNSDVTAPAQSYFPNEFGLYNMSGNVAEFVYRITTDNEDLNYTAKDTVAMGGSWNSPGFDIRISSWVPFKKANPFTGFRPVITYVSRFQ